MWNLESFAAGGRQLCCVRSTKPAGPIVGMIHGVLRSWNYLLPIASRLREAYEICALDQRGHGTSDRAERYLTIDYVEDALAWIRESLGRPVILYGHSLGAMVAAGAAAACPQLVRGVILEDPPFHTLGDRIRETTFHSYFSAIRPFVGSNAPVSESAQRLAELRYSAPGTGMEYRLGDVRDAVSLRFLAATLRRVDPVVVDPIVEGRWLDGYDCDDVFRSIRCPVLLLQADSASGGMLYDVDVQRFKELAGDVTHLRMPGVGHAMHWQRTEEIVNLSFAFCESLDGHA